MKVSTILLAVTCAAIGTSRVALSHHSANTVYDMDNVIEIEGEVLDVSWRNPHIKMTLHVGASGDETIWELEAGAMNTVQRLGVTTDDIHVGDRIRVAGFAGRQRPSSLFVSNALLSDGRELLLLPASPPRWQAASASTSVITDAQAAEANRRAEGLFRVWTRLLSVPPFFDVSLTDEAMARRSRWDPLIDDPTLRCEPPGMVEAMVTPSPTELARDADDIIIRMEEWDQSRRIVMSAPDNQTDVAATPLGFSVGHWDGEVLVVSTNRIDWPYFDDSGTPQSRGVTIEERFSMTADESRMTWRAVIADPENLTEPATIIEEYVWVPGERIRPYNCAL
jgi:hypothetical protein